MPHTSFDTQQHGFRFTNSFDNYRFFGPIEVSVGGRSGGMAYSSLDYFYNRMPIPSQPDLPSEASALSTYISSRQGRSIANQIDTWVKLASSSRKARTSEFFHWGLQESKGGMLELLTREIDAGRPVVLSLFNADKRTRHHQVVAIGYERTGGESPLSIAVYDPNYPGTEKILQAHPQELLYYYLDHDPSVDGRWLTYFVDLNYRIRRPPSEHDQFGCSGIDLSNQNLSGRNLSYGDYTCATCINTNFTGCTINHATFDQADLQNASFYGADLKNSIFTNTHSVSANFYGADMQSSDFSYANAGNSTFRGANIASIVFTGAILDSCDFYGVHGEQAIFERTVCDNANFYGARLHGSLLMNARLRGATFRGAEINGTQAENADFSNANLYGANISGAILYAAVLENANCYGADLSYAALAGADLKNASFYGADLRNADLHGSNLTNANLHGAHTGNTNVIGVTWGNTTCPDGTNSDTNGLGFCILG